MQSKGIARKYVRKDVYAKQEMFVKFCEEYAKVNGHLRMPRAEYVDILYNDGTTKGYDLGMYMNYYRSVMINNKPGVPLSQDLKERLDNLDENWATPEGDWRTELFMLASRVYYNFFGDLRVPKGYSIGIIYKNGVVSIYHLGSIMKLKRQIYKEIKSDKRLSDKNKAEIDAMDAGWILRESEPVDLPVGKKKVVYPNNIKAMKLGYKDVQATKVDKEIIVENSDNRFGEDVARVVLYDRKSKKVDENKEQDEINLVK